MALTGRNVRESSLKLIRDREGLRLNAYQDTKGVWTIGYGAPWYKTWSNRVKEGDTITKEGAEALLKFHADYFAKQGVNRYIKVRLTQNQFDACLSLCFNLGEGNFSRSSVVRLINENPKNIAGIKNSFLEYENINRRKIEAALFVQKDAIIAGGSAIIALLLFTLILKLS